VHEHNFILLKCEECGLEDRAIYNNKTYRIRQLVNMWLTEEKCEKIIISIFGQKIKRVFVNGDIKSVDNPNPVSPDSFPIQPVPTGYERPLKCGFRNIPQCFNFFRVNAIIWFASIEYDIKRILKGGN